jgi:hypothetical protein
VLHNFSKFIVCTYIHICYVLFCSVLCWFTSLCMCLVWTCVKHNVVNTNKIIIIGSCYGNTVGCFVNNKNNLLSDLHFTK